MLAREYAAKTEWNLLAPEYNVARKSDRLKRAVVFRNSSMLWCRCVHDTVARITLSAAPNAVQMNANTAFWLHPLMVTAILPYLCQTCFNNLKEIRRQLKRRKID